MQRIFSAAVAADEVSEWTAKRRATVALKILCRMLRTTFRFIFQIVVITRSHPEPYNFRTAAKCDPYVIDFAMGIWRRGWDSNPRYDFS